MTSFLYRPILYKNLHLFIDNIRAVYRVIDLHLFIDNIRAVYREGRPMELTQEIIDANSGTIDAFFRKVELLSEKYGDPIEPHDFYFELFNEGKDLQTREGSHDGKGNVIVVSKGFKGEGREKRYTIHPDEHFKDLDQIPETDFAFLSPISYFGKNRTLKNARFMYALTLDLDGVGVKQLENLFAQIDNEVIPRPTYIVNSGNGLHLYYKFVRPVPMYPAMQNALKELKTALTNWVWNIYTSTDKKRQMQSINQGFRIVGGVTKALFMGGFPGTTKAWKTGEEVSLDYIQSFLHAIDIDFESVGKYNSKHSIAECKEKFPEWYHRRIELGQAPGQWTVKRDLYDWWIKKIEEGAIQGHRYWCLYTLSVYAVKCGIEFEELEKDAKRLQPIFNEKGKEPFTLRDMRDALKLYKDKKLASMLTRRYLEEQTAISMPANKRNHRKQAEHIKVMNAIREIDHPNGSWRGRKPKEDIVREWQKAHPKGKKIDCAKETGLHINTVYKWWSE